METTRQLAAIMFTDLEGYTALMQKNEQAANERRNRHREVFEKSMAKHSGKILQYYGDGTLSIFTSAIEAVQSGIEMQLQFRKDPQVPLRIGIHLGDIAFDDTGVYGDGVNIASRIESFSVSGAVFISDKVFDEIKNQPQIETVSMGLFDLKNVSRPVEIIAISNEGLAVPLPADLKGKGAEQTNKLAVLPFINMSTDPENEYFSDGISEELINTLSKIGGLQLTCRTSSFSFKGKNLDVREIGKALNVSKVLEGSVRKSGNKVRITAQLVNTADGYQLWSETFDRGLDDIFAVQDEIASIIANRMREQMVSKATESAEPSQNIEAYQLYLKGLFHYNKATPPDYYKAIELFEEAVALDPLFANAHAMIASAYVGLNAIGNVNPEIVVDKARAAARKAIQLDSHLPQAYLSMAMIQLYFEFQFDESLNYINRALLIAPGLSDAHFVASHYYVITNNKKRMVDEAELSLRSDPLSIVKNNQLGETLLFAQRHAEAEKQLLKTYEMNPGWRTPLRNLGLLYIATGEYQKSFEMFDKIRLQVNQPGKGVTGYIAALALLGRKEEAYQYLDEILQRSRADHAVALEGDIAVGYSCLGDLDKAFYYLSLALEKNVGIIFFAIRYPINLFLQKDERYWHLLDKMGLRKYYRDEDPFLTKD